jgi:hypothetical protein
MSSRPGELIAHVAAFASGARFLRGIDATSEPGFALPGLGAQCRLEPGVDWFTTASCGAPARGLPDRFVAAAATRIGAETFKVAIDPKAELSVQVGDDRKLGVVPSVGAQVALGTLEQTAVVVTSDPVFDAEKDTLTIRELKPGLAVLLRVEGLNGLVQAITVADLDGDQRLEVVAWVRDERARKSELWIVN